MIEKLKDYGWCQVIKKDKKYFISYDAGDRLKNLELAEQKIKCN